MNVKRLSNSRISTIDGNEERKKERKNETIEEKKKRLKQSNGRKALQPTKCTYRTV